MKIIRALITVVFIVIIGLSIAKFFIWDVLIQNEDGILLENNLIPVKYADYIDRELDYSWVENNKYIAHALGGIDKHTYTNSREAFIVNYKKGYRIFEVDLIFTSDRILVCKHDWNDYEKIPTKKRFLDNKILDKYTPLTFRQLLNLIERYPDVYIVTDTKSFNYEDVNTTFSYIKSISESVNEELLKRIIPQVYMEHMVSRIEEIHPFNSYIYTLYRSHSSNERILDFGRENGIKVITLPANKVGDRFDNSFFVNAERQENYIFVHTINKLEDVKRLNEIGVYGFYTDFILGDR